MHLEQILGQLLLVTCSYHHLKGIHVTLFLVISANCRRRSTTYALPLFQRIARRYGAVSPRKSGEVSELASMSNGGRIYEFALSPLPQIGQKRGNFLRLQKIAITVRILKRRGAQSAPSPLSRGSKSVAAFGKSKGSNPILLQQGALFKRSKSWGSPVLLRSECLTR